MTRIVKADALSEVTGSRYPPPHDAACRDRAAHRLAPAVGITQFGVNLCRIPPGVWASQRHAHSHEDELVLMLTGTLVLIDDAGEHEVGPGDVIGHPAGDGNAHNSSTAPPPMRLTLSSAGAATPTSSSIPTSP